MNWTSTFFGLFFLLFSFASSFLGCHKKSQTRGTSVTTGDDKERISADPQKSNYKPGHLPEFADPDEQGMDTFYGVRSSLAFPAKNPDGTTIKPRQPILLNQQAGLKLGESQHTNSTAGAAAKSQQSQQNLTPSQQKC